MQPTQTPPPFPPQPPTYSQSRELPEEPGPTEAGARRSTRPAAACLTRAWIVVELRPREAAAEAAAAELVMRTQAGAPAQWWVSQRTRRSTAASLCRLEGLGVRESNWAGGRGGVACGRCQGRGGGMSRGGARWQTRKTLHQHPAGAHVTLGTAAGGK